MCLFPKNVKLVIINFHTMFYLENSKPTQLYFGLPSLRMFNLISSIQSSNMINQGPEFSHVADCGR